MRLVLALVLIAFACACANANERVQVGQDATTSSSAGAEIVIKRARRALRDWNNNPTQEYHFWVSALGALDAAKLTRFIGASGGRDIKDWGHVFGTTFHGYEWAVNEVGQQLKHLNGGVVAPIKAQAVGVRDFRHSGLIPGSNSYGTHLRVYNLWVALVAML